MDSALNSGEAPLHRQFARLALFHHCTIVLMYYCTITLLQYRAIARFARALQLGLITQNSAGSSAADSAMETASQRIIDGRGRE